jgi:hypothetical protein
MAIDLRPGGRRSRNDYSYAWCIGRVRCSDRLPEPAAEPGRFVRLCAWSRARSSGSRFISDRRSLTRCGIQRCNRFHCQPLCIISGCAIRLICVASEFSPHIPISSRGNFDGSRLCQRVASSPARPTAPNVHRVRARRIHRMLSAPGCRSYRLRRPAGLSVACIMREPAHSALEPSVPLDICSCCARARNSFPSSFLSISQDALRGAAVPTTRGEAKLVTQPGVREMLARIEAMPPHDAFFFYPYVPMLPFLARREHVAKYDLFIPGYTLPSQYHDACLSVMRRADWLVIDRTWIGPTAWKLAFPAMQNPQPHETLDFERALDRGFEFVALDGTFELRRRHKDASDVICTGPAE